MNTKQYIYDTHLCTCQHESLLTIGSICDVCMGTVAPVITKDPEHIVGMEVFDEAYFEALESFYEDITFAA